MPESRIFVALSDLLVCLEQYLPNPVCSLAVQPGEGVAFDFGADCAYDGMAWSRLISTWPYNRFPEPVAGALPKVGWKWGYSIELGVMRSYPMDDEGYPQLGDELIRAKAEEQMADMRALQMAILCCFEADKVSIAPYEPRGPEGGAYGGVFQFSASI